MCQPESWSEAPTVSEESITLDVVDGVEDVLEEVIYEQVKQQLLECALNVLRRFAQWCVDRVRQWRQR